MKTFIY